MYGVGSSINLYGVLSFKPVSFRDQTQLRLDGTYPQLPRHHASPMPLTSNKNYIHLIFLMY